MTRRSFAPRMADARMYSDRSRTLWSGRPAASALRRSSQIAVRYAIARTIPYVGR
jgi:hypothetical protein